MENFNAYHNSWDSFYRFPFGAVPAGEKVTLKIKVTSHEKVNNVLLRLYKNSSEEKVVMKEIEKRKNESLYSIEITVPENEGLVWYYFIINGGNENFYYGCPDGVFGGRGSVFAAPPGSFQITVYKRGFKTPDWFKDSVIYQIFTDRFFNGNENGEVDSIKDGCIIHRKWNECPEYSPENINRDFFGGNIEGIIKKLPYLKDLGISVIYLNPIFESPSNHKYNTGDYMKVDPMFGSNETFKELTEKAGRMGISIILDGVFSHTGDDSVYFNKYCRYPSVGAYQSKDSRYYRWYNFTDYPQKYECWWGIDTLPDVNEMEPSYQDFLLSNKNSVIKYWMGLGAAGWRLDVADELPDEFIVNLRKIVKGVNRDAVIIGEVWEDASHKMSYGKMRNYLLGNELDGVMNYPLRDGIINFLTGRIDGSKLNSILMGLYENYPLESFYSLMNILGTHDTVRVLTMLGDSPDENKLSKEDMSRFTLNEDAMSIAKKRLMMASLFEMTFPGVPCIYYGDESGMQGLKDPFNRRTYPWGSEDMELLQWYKKIISIRNRYDFLKSGTFIPAYAGEDVYAYIRSVENGHDVFERERKNGLAIVSFNRSRNMTHTIDIDISNLNVKKFYDPISGVEISAGKNIQSITLQPLTAKLLMAFI